MKAYFSARSGPKALPEPPELITYACISVDTYLRSRPSPLATWNAGSFVSTYAPTAEPAQMRRRTSRSTSAMVGTLPGTQVAVSEAREASLCDVSCQGKTCDIVTRQKQSCHCRIVHFR